MSRTAHARRATAVASALALGLAGLGLAVATPATAAQAPSLVTPSPASTLASARAATARAATARAATAQRVAVLPRPRTGLRVVVSAAPAVRSRVRVTVTGPNGFQRRIRSTTYWPGAVPGRYRITAPPLMLHSVAIRPTVRPRRIVLVRRPAAGQLRGAAVAVAYRLPPGCIRPGPVAVAWGDGANGRLGDRATADRLRPVRVRNMSGATAITGGGQAAYARCRNGTLWAWGYDGYGALGNGAGGSSTVPVRVRGLGGMTAVAGRDRGGLGLRSDGTVWSWGWGNYGQLGNGRVYGAATIAHLPVRVAGLAGVTAIAGGGNSGYALRSDGTVWAWGNGTGGQLGHGVGADSAIPVQVSGLTGVIAIAAGRANGYALRSDGTVWAWGQDGNGQLGNGFPLDSSSVPVRVSVPGGVTVADVEAGFSAGYVLLTDGTVWAWGSQRYGELGNGVVSNSPQTVPGPVAALDGVRSLASFGHTAYARRSDGTVRAWGAGENGQLGERLIGADPVPREVPGLAGVRAVGAGMTSAYALRR